MVAIEPAVKPQPKIKPRPTEKPRPRKNDPWTVPGPKVNPTPKAQEMNKLKGKILIDNRSDFDLYASMMKVDAFFAKYYLSEKLMTELTAENAVKRSQKNFGAN